jgi:hypothetical protein
MTFAAQANDYGKALVYLVEISSPKCTRAYGVAPCTAALGVTGSQKCFNTMASCQDPANFAQTEVPYRFSSVRLDALQAPGDAPTMPTVLSLQSTTAVLTPGKGLGVRSSVEITIQDHPWGDVGADPYLSTRPYNPETRGTFWGKWLARNRYWANRKLTVRTGYLTNDGLYDAANFRTRSYVITEISGPDANGIVRITGKDPLRFADGEKAKVPQASIAKLVGDITSGDTSITVAPAQDLLDWWTSGQRYVRIEDEIMLVTAQTGIGTGTATLTVTRGSMPTRYEPAYNVSDPHKTGSSLVPCHWYAEQMIYDVLYHLLNTVAGIDASFLDYANWKALIDDQYSYLSISALLTSPVDAKRLITELTELGIVVWWHDRDQLVRLKGIRPSDPSVAYLDESSNLIADSVQVHEDTSNLVTQAWMMYDLSWPLANMALLQSYRVTDVRANLDRESTLQYGWPAIRTVQTRWLDAADGATVIQVNGNLLQQYEVIRKVLAFSLDPKDDGFWVGDIVTVQARQVQNIYGATVATPILLTQMQESGDTTGMTYKCVGLEVQTAERNAKITHPEDLSDLTPAPADYTSASALEKASWVYISQNDGTMPGDGASAYEME